MQHFNTTAASRKRAPHSIYRDEFAAHLAREEAAALAAADPNWLQWVRLLQAEQAGQCIDKALELAVREQAYREVRAGGAL